MPSGYSIIKGTSPLSFYQPSKNSFIRKDTKYAFMFYLLNPNMKNMPINTYMCLYDFQTLNVQIEQFKQPNEPIHQFDNNVNNIISQSIDICKQRNGKQFINL